MEASAGSMTQFTGTLVGRQYKPGQKYIQLVFKTAEGLHLSITRNLQMVRSLSVGKTYHVKGEEFTLGKKQVIREPVAILVQPKLALRKRRYLIITGAVVLLAAGTAGAVSLKSPHGTAPASLKTNIKKINVQKPQSQSVSTTSAVTTPTPPASPVAITPVKKTAAVKTTQTATPATTSQTPSNASAAVDNQQPQNTPVNDTSANNPPVEPAIDPAPPPPSPPPTDDGGATP
jgi:hypothetical protein